MSVLYDKDDNVLGFYKDLKVYLADVLRDYTENEDWENVSEVAGLLTELGRWADNTNLLVLSENNGMGNTIKEYRGQQ